MARNTDARHYHTVEQALRFLQSHHQSRPSLADIARHCALSEHHFQRIFKQWAGVSPKRFLQCLTREQCRSRLIQGASLDEVSIGAGLSGSSRLHDLLVTLDAVTPGEIKSGGRDLNIRWNVQQSPFGECFLATTERGIHRLEFIPEGRPEAALQSLREQWPLADIGRDNKLLPALIEQIFCSSSIEREKSTLPLALCLKGSPFQFKVWEALLKIPMGKLCTYGQLATTIGAPSAARAVGNAVARNPVAALIPCHRVIRNMGIIGHYRWGEVRKQALLGWEAGQFDTPVADTAITDTAI